VMQTALDAGNRAEVIRQFQRLRDRLRADLGLGPAASTVAIYEKALSGQAAEPVSIADRIRASLAWGIIHLNSGDFPKAEKTAHEARALAIDAGLGREVGEASALVGLVAHMQGKWPLLFKAEFTDWIRRSPAFVSNVFDGHLCLAEFCLCGPNGHDAMAAAAGDLLEEATSVGSNPGRALALLILGEGKLFSNDLVAADRLLAESDQLYEKIGWASGRVVALQRLAEVAVAKGQRWKAARIVQRGFRIAESNWLAPHLLLRLQALAVDTATSKPRAVEAIAQGDRWLAEGTHCQPCSMAFRVASSIALAEAGEVEQARRRIDEAERLAGMWNGGPWGAAVWEARGVQRRAEGNNEQAAALFREAAARYGSLGRRGDEARCLDRASPTARVIV
jgi:tetratricopeptide (TPR) repeat protein